MSVFSELTRDGQVVIRRFVSSDEAQVIDCAYLLISSDGRVFVADSKNNIVILLDSDLKWNRILCPATEEKKKQFDLIPFTMFYDEEMSQLIVGQCLGNQINVYTIRRN